MAETLIASAVAYISTNIDDIFVLMILLAQAAGSSRRQLAGGYFLGVFLLTAVSMLAAAGLQDLSLNYVGLLGLVPIGLGIRAWVEQKTGSGNGDAPQIRLPGLMNMMLITLGNGADNVGVYIPLFTGFSGPERTVSVAVFVVMAGAWVILANILAAFPGVKTVIRKYQPVLIPAVFILLGVYIILDSGLLA